MLGILIEGFLQLPVMDDSLDKASDTNLYARIQLF